MSERDREHFDRRLHLQSRLMAFFTPLGIGALILALVLLLGTLVRQLWQIATT